MQEVHGELTELGFQIIGISPDPSETIALLEDENDYGYTLLSDNGFDAILAFGLGYEVSEEIKKKYTGYGISFYAQSEGAPVLLPVPAVYLVDTNGEIAFRFFDANYKVRLDAAELLAAARLMSQAD